jgi:hypothetical protein
MDYPLVLAQAFRGQPLRRLVVEKTHRAVFLVNPDYLAAVEAGESGAAGFPVEDVFEFDADLYQRLREQWERDGRTDDTLWRSARPYNQPPVA